VDAKTTQRQHIRVRRYSGSARINHWIVATSFVLLAISGLSLFHPSLYPIGATLFGSGQTLRWIHPWIGVILVIGFLGLFIRFLPANLPESTDFVWLSRIREVLAAQDEYLPEVGKYNAGQKFVFWAQAVLVTILFVTGLALWDQELGFFEGLTGYQLTMDDRRLAAVIHATCAVLTIMVWIVHVYAAIWVKGTIPAMVEGTVSGGWGWRFHRKWLRRKVPGPSAIERADPPRLQAGE